MLYFWKAWYSRILNMIFPFVMKSMKVMKVLPFNNSCPFNWSTIHLFPPFNWSPNSGQIIRLFWGPMEAIFHSEFHWWIYMSFPLSTPFFLLHISYKESWRTGLPFVSIANFWFNWLFLQYYSIWDDLWLEEMSLPAKLKQVVVMRHNYVLNTSNGAGKRLPATLDFSNKP